MRNPIPTPYVVKLLKRFAGIPKLQTQLKRPTALTDSLPEAKSRRADASSSPEGTGCRLVGNYDLGILEPSVAQPPLPLQLFLPLQPLSPLLQPPLPLQEFWPLQACFSGFLVVSGLSWLSAENDALAVWNTVEAWTTAPVPASRPATAALVMRALVVLVMGDASLQLNYSQFGQGPASKPQRDLGREGMRSSGRNRSPSRLANQIGRNAIAPV